MENPMTDGFERRAEQWYESKIVFLITILSPVVVIMMFIFGMRTDIALIQQDINTINSNHEVHIQDINQELKEQKEQIIQTQKDIVELQKQLITVLGK